VLPLSLSPIDSISGVAGLQPGGEGVGKKASQSPTDSGVALSCSDVVPEDYASKRSDDETIQDACWLNSVRAE
jgi:hypothetical protein